MTSRHGRQLTPGEAESLMPGTELLCRDRRSGSGFRLARVKEYQQIGAARVLVVELEDGSKRSPLSSSLYWLTPIDGDGPPDVAA